MTTAPQSTISYRAIDLRNIAEAPQWSLLDEEIREAIEVVGQVLPFRTNQYVLDHLIDWSKVPNDPIFQLVFPQSAMLSPGDLDAVRTLLKKGASRAEVGAEVDRIRLDLNPHPAGQLTHNVPTLNGRQRWTPSTGQLINVAKWNLLRYIPVKRRGAEDDKEETAKSFASV
jgi:hypothetical protein